MSGSGLPPRASLEYLKKLARDRVRELRRTRPEARLAEAQLLVAREHGFASWRALRAELDRRAAAGHDAYFAACAAGDAAALHDLLRARPALTAARNADGATGLHLAVRHHDVVRLLLAHGADPNVRDTGDNALPLHFAAGGGPLESVLALLDAGSDVHGTGDAHAMDVIGRAVCVDDARRDVADLLVSRGARHHVFSAVALKDPDLLRRVVAADPAALHRRLSRFEQEQTALHYVIAPADGLVGGRFRTGDHYPVLALLLELGADVDAVDAKGRTPLALAMLRGDREAMRLLHAAGARPAAAVADVPDARPPATPPAPRPAAGGDAPAALDGSIGRLTPLLPAPDLQATIAWYRAVGFTLVASHGEGDAMDWASVRFGDAEIMFVPAEPRGRLAGLSLWIRTDRLDELYALLRQRQLERATAVLAGVEPDAPELRFTADLYTAFYGQREFAIRDPDGVELCFFQPLEE